MMIGADILGQRVLLKLTQAGMAAAMGISLRHYHRCESSIEPVPEKIENLVKLAVSRAAAHQPKLDGRFKKPVNWLADHGKPIFVYEGLASAEVGIDQGDPGDPARRFRAKTLEEAQFKMKHWPVNAIEERETAWHVAIKGATIPPEVE